MELGDPAPADDDLLETQRTQGQRSAEQFHYFRLAKNRELQLDLTEGEFLAEFFKGGFADLDPVDVVVQQEFLGRFGGVGLRQQLHHEDVEEALLLPEKLLGQSAATG